MSMGRDNREPTKDYKNEGTKMVGTGRKKYDTYIPEKYVEKVRVFISTYEFNGEVVRESGMFRFVGGKHASDVVWAYIKGLKTIG